MAAIYDTNGEEICDGLQGSEVCDEAIKAAREIAAARNEPVVLYDDDGEWVVHPDGHCDEVDSDSSDDED